MKKMLKFGCFGAIGLLFVVVILVAVMPQTAAVDPGEVQAQAVEVALPTVTPPANWYSGGTLHGSTQAEWLQADDADKLATASDWYVAARELKNLQLEDESILRTAAEQMVLCIDEMIPVVLESYDDTEKTAGIAIMCAAFIADELPAVKALEE